MLATQGVQIQLSVVTYMSSNYFSAAMWPENKGTWTDDW